MPSIALTPAQKYAIATLLATSSLDSCLRKLRSSGLHNTQDGIAFALLIDRFYSKRDGFVPRKVINLLCS